MTPCPSCGAPFTPSLPDQTLCDACAGLSPPEESSPLQQTRVGGYTLIHQLGAGRFSTSWLAEQPDGAGVVLKLLRSYAPDEGTVARFIAEATRLSQAGPHDHSGVARVLEAGVQIGGALFLVYESGGELTMADELRGRGRMVPARAVALCAQLCEGLSALHGAGLVHQGLKPANVGLAKEEDGTECAVLLDAFTAHLLTKAGLRETGLLPISTAAYLSPEESLGHLADARADLYAIGVLLFQLVSGRLPVMGSTSEELIEAHKNQRALRLRDVGRKVHPELEGVLARLLAKDPAGRFPDAGSACQALRGVQTEPVAGAADAADEEVEDPVPILSSEPPPESVGSIEDEQREPEVEPPRAPVPLDPALEAALLGHVPPGAEREALARPVATAPGSAFPSWLTPLRAGAAAAVLCALAVSLVFALGGESRRKRRAAAAPAPSAEARAKPAPTPTPAPPPEPPPAPVTVEPVAQAAPKPVSKVAAVKPVRPAAPKLTLTPPPPPSKLGEPKGLLAKGDGAGASKALEALLAGGLSSTDQALATRLMAEAQALAGNKPSAVAWYRKYLHLAADSDERARVVKKIAELNR